MSEEKRVVELDGYEQKLIANILLDRREDLKKENKDYDFIDDVLEKVLKAPIKRKLLFKKDKEKDER